MHMRRVFAGLALALVFTASCSKASQAPGPRSSSNLITQDEIVRAPEGNLYDTVQRLRPGFLRARSTASSSNAYPVVYVNGQRRGSLEYLRAISNREVIEIRYLSALDATTRYGMNVEAGVLDVKLISR
jgi:hypothetical protein